VRQLLLASLAAALPLLAPTRPGLGGLPEPVSGGGSTWPGYSDGRLNPDPAEYYSVWCAFDALEVWRSVPAPLLLAAVPIADVFRLEEGGSLELPDAMGLVRSTADTITVSGSNGNAAPSPGSKSFSLSECIARNGGVPLDELPEEEPEPGPAPEDELSDYEWEVLFCHEGCVDSTDCPVLCDYLCVYGTEPPTLGSARLAPSITADDLSLLYAVRDQILAPSLEGLRYTALFDAHQAEILLLLVIHWGRWEEGFSVLERFLPHLRALVEGRGAKGRLKRADLEAADRFLDHLARSASPALAQAIADERALHPLAAFEGMNAETARAVAVGCDGIAEPFAAAGCALGELLDPDVCAGSAIERGLARALAKGVPKGQRLLAKARVQSSPEKQAHLAVKTDARLAKLEAKLARAADTPPACRDELAALLAERRLLLQALP
jgi:hypothetical protein